MKKASDDQAVAYKAQTKEDEASVDKNWLASRLPYTERSGSGRVRGFSNGNTRRTAVKKSAGTFLGFREKSFCEFWVSVVDLGEDVFCDLWQGC